MRFATYVAVATAANFVVAITMDHVGCVRLLLWNISPFFNTHSDFLHSN